jgi:GntR family transcriptional repressor for pyruvate dehydrogenase complex
MINMVKIQNKIKRAVRLTDQVADTLYDQIKSGIYQPGETIASEVELAAQFGVSRTVLREALAHLKYEGILHSKQGSGLQVGSFANVRTFRLEVQDEANVDEILSLYELRAILEGDATALAAERRSRKQLADLKNCLVKIHQAIEKGKDYSAADAAFHETITKASGNPFLSDFMVFLSDKLRNLSRRARDRVSRSPEMQLEVQEEHDVIFQAISDSDPQKAKEAALEHLRNAFKRQKIIRSKSLKIG